VSKAVASAPQTSSGVLLDRLEGVRTWPDYVHLWHRLFAAISQTSAEQRAVALKQVRGWAPTSGSAGFLAATFLFGLEERPGDLRAASSIFVGNELPLDAGQALLNVAFAKALRSVPTSGELVNALIAAGFVQVLQALGQRIAQTTCHEATGIKAKPGPINRVALFAPSLSAMGHAPTDMALHHARVLASQGLEVRLFSAQEFRLETMPLWLGAPKNMVLAPIPAEGWPRLPHRLDAVIANEKLSMGARWKAVMLQLRRFSPDVVLFVGPFSPMLFTLFREFPAVGLGTNTFAPAGPLDVWLAPREQAPQPWLPSFSASQVMLHERRLSLVVASHGRDRRPLGLPSDAVVWITSGTRLDAEVGGEWLTMVLTALDAHPGCHWLLVGNGQNAIKGLDRQHPRIHLLAYEPELSALLKACDIYLNPPRVGGGVSVAHAMAQGLAVLSLHGSDGGDKVGEWAHADLDAYGSSLSQLSRNAEARRTLGKALEKRWFERFNLEAAGPTLVNACELARQVAAGRMPEA
jgi:hypothetical protein